MSTQISEQRYRITAPTATQRPKRKIEKNKRAGRENNEFRQIFMKTGVITQATGSAYLEMNRTKVICGVYGPLQTNKIEYSDKGKIVCEFKHSTFSSHGERKKNIQDKEERAFSICMTQALEVSVILEKFPKSVIEIHALVLEADGGVLSAAITCASLALANAGIEMYDLVSACSVGLVDNQIILDPEGTEEKMQTASVTVACMPSLNEITQLFQTGEISHTKVQEGIDLCLDGCSKIYALMRSAIHPKPVEAS